MLGLPQPNWSPKIVLKMARRQTVHEIAIDGIELVGADLREALRDRLRLEACREIRRPQAQESPYGTSAGLDSGGSRSSEIRPTNSETVGSQSHSLRQPVWS